MNKESAVLSFIKKERKKGTKDQQIKHMLLDAGWQMDIIQHAMGERINDVQLGDTPAAKQAAWRQHVTNPYVVGIAGILLILIALFI